MGGIPDIDENAYFFDVAELVNNPRDYLEGVER